jgi:hypothetical protein
MRHLCPPGFAALSPGYGFPLGVAATHNAANLQAFQIFKIHNGGVAVMPSRRERVGTDIACLATI